VGGGDFVSLGGRLAALLLRTALVAVAVAALVGVAMAVRGRRREAGPVEAEPRARGFLRIATAALWIVDGLLQMQPLMPAGFVPANIEPSLDGDPGWLRGFVELLTRAWDRHPVVADVALVWVEIGLGLLLLVGRRGLLGKVAAVSAGLAGLAIWALGEAFGGQTVNGAGWLTGAPGAALVYVAAAGLLLLPWQWWRSGRAVRIVRHVTAAWLAIGGVLQVIPAERFFTADGLSAPFADGASTSQPAWLQAPIQDLATLTARHPALVNTVVVVVVLGVAAWLELDAGAGPVIAALVVCGATWWLAQDFGVLGGTATDPNAALPLGLLAASALPYWSQPVTRASRSAERFRSGPAVTVVRRAAVALAAVLAFALPLALTVGLAGPADSAALAADSQGGLRTIPARPMPGFTLVDQHGVTVDSAALRGKIVVLTFLDPVCTSECPLIANQLAVADRRLGALADKVRFIAIDSNPIFHNVADVAAFTESHGLAGLPNWHFLCGEPALTQGLLTQYGASIDVPAVGMIAHSEDVFFVSPDGTERAYLDDGAAEQLTGTYADAVVRELRLLAR
jgi:cytochrome oxidase Cu insertion factor (SCO1/SenC/PrrC family)